jgi:hypothetical protein
MCNVIVSTLCKNDPVVCPGSVTSTLLSKPPCLLQPKFEVYNVPKTRAHCPHSGGEQLGKSCVSLVQWAIGRMVFHQIDPHGASTLKWLHIPFLVRGSIRLVATIASRHVWQQRTYFLLTPTPLPDYADFAHSFCMRDRTRSRSGEQRWSIIEKVCLRLEFIWH